MRIIEFTGVTGAGKTTLLPFVKKAFSECHVPVFTRVEAILICVKRISRLGWVLSFLPREASSYLASLVFKHLYWNKYKIKFITENMEMFNEVLSSQARRPIVEAHKKEIVKWFISFGGFYQFFEEHMNKDDAVIFCEGFTHRVANLFASENEDVSIDLITSYLKTLPGIYLLIKVNADLGLCKERVLSRGLTFRLKESKDVEKFISNSVQAIEIATRYLRQKKTNVIELDNDSSLDETVKNAGEIIREHLKNVDLGV